MIRMYCDACGRETSEETALKIEVHEATFHAYGDPKPGVVHLCGPGNGADVGCNQRWAAAIEWIGEQREDSI